MEITQTVRGSTTIIRLRGRWVCGYDLRTELRAHIQRLTEAGQVEVELDLGGVTFADSTVMGEIASTHITLQRRGGRLTLLNPTPRMFRLLAVSRLASVIDIRHDAESLTAAWNGSAVPFQGVVELKTPAPALTAVPGGPGR
ncbi:MAG: STAS domain-containing protein [Vicinamibacterales bacterium]|nr:STAS domain-containing protein [Vicinamibacterales bacterium]